LTAKADGTGGPVFNSILFRQDVIDNVDSRGKVQFKHSWTERHETFFVEFQNWMAVQGMWQGCTQLGPSKAGRVTP
jgi:hypothetical protein